MALLSTDQLISYISSQYTIYVSFIIIISGLIGNLLNIIVFTKLKQFRGNQCILYLLIESISNIGELTLVFVLRLLFILYGDDRTQYSFLWCKFKSILGQLFLLLSIFIVCFTTYDQFLSTSYLFYLRQMSTLKLARRLAFVTISCALFHSILCGLLFDYRPLIACGVFNPVLIHYFSYFFYPVLCGLLPISITSSFSLLAYRNVRRITRRQLNISRRRLDRQLTAMVLARVVFFIIFKTSFASHRIYTINITIDPTDSLRLAIENLISVIISSLFNADYAINFYVFLAASTRYRRQVKHIIIKKYCRQWKQWFTSSRNQVNPAIELQPVSSVGQ